MEDGARVSVDRLSQEVLDPSRAAQRKSVVKGGHLTRRSLRAGGGHEGREGRRRTEEDCVLSRSSGR